MIRYEAFKGKKRFRQAWFWHVKASNGQVLATSEAYTNYADAVHAAELVAHDTEFQRVHTPSE